MVLKVHKELFFFFDHVSHKPCRQLFFRTIKLKENLSTSFDSTHTRSTPISRVAHQCRWPFMALPSKCWKTMVKVSIFSVQCTRHFEMLASASRLFPTLGRGCSKSHFLPVTNGPIKLLHLSHGTRACVPPAPSYSTHQGQSNRCSRRNL